MESKSALLIIDIQNDFCLGGALAVPEGNQMIAVVNKYIQLFLQKNLAIFISRDWHPKDTSHFEKFGGLWPIHCVQDTKGAGFHPDLKIPKEAIVLSKGMDPSDKDSYSDFRSFSPDGVAFIDLLKNQGIEELFVGGIATDYCVKFTVLDALKSGFKVKLLMDAIKGVNLEPSDSEEAIKEMSAQGARRMVYEQVVGLLTR